MSKPTFYITTPIYYASSNLHIGNAYCTTAADTMARFKKLSGYDVYFLTGTDEHGQKIERSAAAAGKTPQVFVDDIIAGIKDLWKIMDIDYDDFLRTTEDRHKRVVQRIFKQLYDQGDIYKSTYEGWYCTPCESFWTDFQLAEGGMCPDCGRPVEKTREESYFLRLSKYAPWLIRHIQDHPEFIQPAARANEMLNNFLLPGLQDLCVSRASFKWGIPVDFDPDHVVYVWIDALSNYITALGWDSGDDSLYRRYWPADIHLVGKEIVRFHTIYWPIMLHALGLPLPKQIFGHGWLTMDGQKISKSLGNGVDPVYLCGRYGTDAVRYFLMREMPFGADGNYTHEALLTRINSDLANDLGNLVSRTAAMIQMYEGGLLPERGALTEAEQPIVEAVAAVAPAMEKLMDQLQFSLALKEIWKLVALANRYIDQTEPWNLVKAEDGRPRLKTVLYTLAEAIRVIATLIGPFMPSTPAKIRAQLGIPEDLAVWDTAARYGILPAGLRVQKGDAIFPRIDITAELSADKPTPATPAPPRPSPREEPKEAAPITIDDFLNVQLRVARVTACEKVPKADKLLKLSLAVGGEERTVVSGIAEYYAPDEMIGRSVVLVANLQPAKLRGIVSEGMILCAVDGQGGVKLVSPVDEIADGSIVR